jgi:hypothetical protein
LTAEEVRPTGDFTYKTFEVAYYRQLLEWEKSHKYGSMENANNQIPSERELFRFSNGSPLSSFTADRHVNNKTFAGRLDLACALRAYGRLKDPAITTAELSRGFGFLMAVVSRDQITAYFKDFLDSLECI